MWLKTDCMHMINLDKGYSVGVGTDEAADILKHVVYLRYDNSQGNYDPTKDEWIMGFEDMNAADIFLDLIFSCMENGKVAEDVKFLELYARACAEKGYFKQKKKGEGNVD